MDNRFETFVSLIFEINRGIQKIKDAEMGKLGLKASHTMCLYYLYQNKDGLTATKMTELCSIDKAAISRTLKQLVDKDLIYCDNSGQKLYKNRYFLTEKGEEWSAKLMTAIANAMVNVSLDVDEADRESLYKSLGTIRDNLNNYLK